MKFVPDMKAKLIIALVAILAVLPTAYAIVDIKIDASKPGPVISPFMWGIFFEDINFAADGGISAELIKNRGFEFPDHLMGWKIICPPNSKATVFVTNSTPFNVNNSNYLRISNDSYETNIGIENNGFRGIGVKSNETYNFSAWLRSAPASNFKIEVRLISIQGQTLASVKISNINDKWTHNTLSLKPNSTDAKASLQILVSGKGTIDLDMISLYPKNTWKNRPNGLRADIVQMLADLHPGFMRFPGGCIVEGRTLENRYQWKNTIGKPENRKLIINRWNTEFKHRPAPDYYQSYALGFFEFFQLCEDIGATPLPIINCGMACQFNSGELAPMDQLDQYIQDALDLIEFANGPITSKWGKVRADLGHPKPFNLKMLGIGNEQWGPQYIERYRVFANILKSKHPEILLVSSAGPDPDGEKFDFLWTQLRKLNADIIDEHYYRPPKWFLENTHRYDSYNRTGPKVFAGEYAAQSVGVASPANQNTLECAIAEAAFMTGLERNADVVVMSSYAPLLAHVDAWQWTPDLIWFDNLNVYGTPSYYVQKMFSNNRGNFVIKTEISGIDPKKPVFANSVFDKNKNEIILKLVNPNETDFQCQISIDGTKLVHGTSTVSILSGNNPSDSNSIQSPTNIVPKISKININTQNFIYTAPKLSFSVIRIPTKK